MSFDEEPEDIHGECRAEIHRLTARVAELTGMHNAACSSITHWENEADRLRAALEPLVNAAVARELPTNRHTRQGQAALARPAVETKAG